jgi:hypothetical protein
MIRVTFAREVAAHDGYCSGSECEYIRDDIDVWYEDAATLVVDFGKWTTAATAMDLDSEYIFDCNLSGFSFYNVGYDNVIQTNRCRRTSVPNEFTEDCNVVRCSFLRFAQNVSLRFAWVSACVGDITSEENDPGGRCPRKAGGGVVCP